MAQAPPPAGGRAQAPSPPPPPKQKRPDTLAPMRSWRFWVTLAILFDRVRGREG